MHSARIFSILHRAQLCFASSGDTFNLVGLNSSSLIAEAEDTLSAILMLSMEKMRSWQTSFCALLPRTLSSPFLEAASCSSKFPESGNENALNYQDDGCVSRWRGQRSKPRKVLFPEMRCFLCFISTSFRNLIRLFSFVGKWCSAPAECWMCGVLSFRTNRHKPFEGWNECLNYSFFGPKTMCIRRGLSWLEMKPFSSDIPI